MLFQLNPAGLTSLKYLLRTHAPDGNEMGPRTTDTGVRLAQDVVWWRRQKHTPYSLLGNTKGDDRPVSRARGKCHRISEEVASSSIWPQSGQFQASEAQKQMALGQS